MGRKRKYFSEKERREAQRQWKMEHYKRNAEEIRAKARQRYRDKKKSAFYYKKIQDLYGNLDT